MYASIFNNRFWAFERFDGRRKEFRGITKAEFEEAKKKHQRREINRFQVASLSDTKSQKFVKWMKYFATIPYEYVGDGLDDFNHYQRPASNGVGYVDICPGERMNNHYVDEPHLVAALTRKYNAWKQAR